MADEEMSEEEWKGERKRNVAKTGKGNKRDNETTPRRDDNRRDDHHLRDS